MVEYSLAKAKVEGSNPFFRLGLSRLELLTLRLSGVYSNQLSYKPIHTCLERFELSTFRFVV